MLAIFHLKHTFVNFMKALLYVFEPRNYYLALRSTFYFALIPGACAGEIIYDKDKPFCSHFYALGVGSAVWGGLLLGSIVITSQAINAGEKSDLSALEDSRLSSKIWITSLIVFLMITYGLIFRRKDYNSPASSSKTAPSFTYHQFLALFTPLIETAQLCGIIGTACLLAFVFGGVKDNDGQGTNMS